MLWCDGRVWSNLVGVIRWGSLRFGMGSSVEFTLLWLRHHATSLRMRNSWTCLCMWLLFRSYKIADILLSRVLLLLLHCSLFSWTLDVCPQLHPNSKCLYTSLLDLGDFLITKLDWGIGCWWAVKYALVQFMYGYWKQWYHISTTCVAVHTCTFGKLIDLLRWTRGCCVAWKLT